MPSIERRSCPFRKSSSCSNAILGVAADTPQRGRSSTPSAIGACRSDKLWCRQGYGRLLQRSPFNTMPGAFQSSHKPCDGYFPSHRCEPYSRFGISLIPSRSVLSSRFAKIRNTNEEACRYGIPLGGVEHLATKRLPFRQKQFILAGAQQQ